MALTAKGFLVGESPTLPEKVCITHFPLLCKLFVFILLLSSIIDCTGCIGSGV